jgi:hypothetical protein
MQVAAQVVIGLLLAQAVAVLLLKILYSSMLDLPIRSQWVLVVVQATKAMIVFFQQYLRQAAAMVQVQIEMAVLAAAAVVVLVLVLVPLIKALTGVLGKNKVGLAQAAAVLVRLEVMLVLDREILLLVETVVLELRQPLQAHL